MYEPERLEDRAVGTSHPNKKKNMPINRLIWSHLFLTACFLIIIGCNKSPPAPITFPQYVEPVAVVNENELYYDVYVGELLLQDGCLRLTGTGPKFPEIGYLLVWPLSFSLHTVAASVSVVSSGGVIVARVGDTIGLSANEVEEQPSSADCAGPYLAVSEDVRAVIADDFDEIESPDDASPSLPKFALRFPKHEQPISTGDGSKIFLGELVVKDGCLRLIGDRLASLGDVYQKYPIGGFLLVWPPGYSLNAAADPAQIVDNMGLIVARVGDTIRVTANGWSPTRSGPADPPATPIPLPLGCDGPRLLVGDQVHAVTPDEPAEINLPGSPLFFPRQKTPVTLVELQLVHYPGELILDGDCLLWRPDWIRPPPPRRLLVWPPGFTPHIDDGEFVVRNGGGRTVARVGDTVSMIVSSGPDYPGKCGGVETYLILRLSTADDGN